MEVWTQLSDSHTQTHTYTLQKQERKKKQVYALKRQKHVVPNVATRGCRIASDLALSRT